MFAQLHEVGIEAIADLVDARLDGHGGTGQIGVAVHEGLHGIVQHRDGKVGNLVEFVHRRLIGQRAEQ